MRAIQKIFFIFFIFLQIGSFPAQASKKEPLPIQTDNSTVVVRKFDQKAISDYKRNRDFQYGEIYHTSESVWDKFWRWLWSKLSKASSAADGSVFYISLFLLTSALIFLIIKFMGVSVSQPFSGKIAHQQLNYSEALENIHEINFDQEIEKAIKNNDYRLAVRILYLKCLKDLSDQGLILWQIDKTNSAYIRELQDGKRKRKFASLTREFEYIWYGGFEVNKAFFIEIHADFNEFNTVL